MANNRKCLTCSTEYSYCPNCSRADALKPYWYAEFCSDTCKNLWTTCVRYNLKKLTKQEAQEIIKSLPLKPNAEYVACVQRDLDIILKEEPKPKRTKRTMAQPVDESAKTEPTIIEQITYEVVKQENE